MSNIRDIFTEYEKTLTELDSQARKVYTKLHLPCKQHCPLCCFQVFPINFLEAYYLNEKYKQMDRKTRRTLEKTAIKIMQKMQEAQNLEQINLNRENFYARYQELQKKLKGLTIHCPMLIDKNCSVYEARPHDCRVHGCSFDTKSNEIVGCRKFTPAVIFQPNFIENLMDFNTLIPESSTLSRSLTQAVNLQTLPKNTFYFTSFHQAILKDYEGTNWTTFFQEKFSGRNIEENAYHLILDLMTF